MSAEPSSRRYFDPRFDADIITVPPGGHAITAAPKEILATVLGSCVSVCMRDPQVGVGGINHFLLPLNTEATVADPLNAAERYGDTAMEILINGLFKQGARRGHLEAKVVGGGRVLPGKSALMIGSGNVSFVLGFLARENIPIVSKDVGGTKSRRLHYQPATGRAWVRHLETASTRDNNRDELAYLDRLQTKPIAGGVEIF
jgi:chemotaxis protein CheD